MTFRSYFRVACWHLQWSFFLGGGQGVVFLGCGLIFLGGVYCVQSVAELHLGSKRKENGQPPYQGNHQAPRVAAKGERFTWTVADMYIHTMPVRAPALCRCCVVTDVVHSNNGNCNIKNQMMTCGMHCRLILSCMLVGHKEQTLLGDWDTRGLTCVIHRKIYRPNPDQFPLFPECVLKSLLSTPKVTVFSHPSADKNCVQSGREISKKTAQT